MRIGIDVRNLQTAQRYRGIGEATRRLLEGLSALDHESEYLLIRFDTEDRLDVRLHPSFRWREIRAGPPPGRLRDLRWLADRFTLRRLARKEDLSVLHITAPLELFYGFPPEPGPAALVVTLYDLIPLHRPEEAWPHYRPLMRWLYAMHLAAARQARCVMAISAATRRELVEGHGFAPERVRVVSLAASEAFRPATTGETHGAPYALHVGGDGYNKNLPAVLEAVAIARRKGLACDLVLSGNYATGRVQPLIDRFAGEFGGDAVRVLGFVPQGALVRLYQGAAALVFPSSHEGFGLPVLEAMACGTPVIVADTPALTEVGGDAVLVARGGTADAVAERLIQVLTAEGLRGQLAERGLRRASDFSWDRAARQTLEVYRSVAPAK